MLRSSQEMNLSAKPLLGESRRRPAPTILTISVDATHPGPSVPVRVSEEVPVVVK